MSRDKNVNKCIEQLLHVARSADLFFVQVSFHDTFYCCQFCLYQLYFLGSLQSKNFRAISVDEMRQRLTEVAGEDSEISTLNSTGINREKKKNIPFQF